MNAIVEQMKSEIESLTKERDKFKAAYYSAEKCASDLSIGFAKLQTERDECRHGSEFEMNSAIKFCQERNAARIERDALAADAARYRFIAAHIADEGDMDVLERAFEALGESDTCTQVEFDACIDAAIVKEQRQAGVQ